MGASLPKTIKLPINIRIRSTCCNELKDEIDGVPEGKSVQKEEKVSKEESCCCFPVPRSRYADTVVS